MFGGLTGGFGFTVTSFAKFDSGGPMRRIPLSRRSHVTGFQPVPTGTAEHESALERDFVTLTAFADPAATITSQPVTIRFDDGGKLRRYTPDFLVRWSDGRSDLVEVKYRADLRAFWAQLRPGFAAARAWTREHKTSFHIATERGIRVPRLENAKRLIPLRRAALDPVAADRMLRVARALSAPTFGRIVEAMDCDRAIALATMWRLIARGSLSVDLNAPIRLDTPVTAP
ncbi:TnsA endonuclease N-terminal domain-containing protein [Bradyrhizobium sp. CCBAU 45389]|uniref:TnsA endonuclease N-terminal domain-containing protein n=1 Tax=Bradyrhizobium sp. CCBAU 45389 TaxID=858429 RepID=UPI00230665A0|nr:TnsA endonuclease N-terminal domain-containing protein [Bradyrhizobium sp. CCBAU 45389]